MSSSCEKWSCSQIEFYLRSGDNATWLPEQRHRGCGNIRLCGRPVRGRTGEGTASSSILGALQQGPRFGLQYGNEIDDVNIGLVLTAFHVRELRWPLYLARGEECAVRRPPGFRVEWNTSSRYREEFR